MKLNLCQPSDLYLSPSLLGFLFLFFFFSSACYGFLQHMQRWNIIRKKMGNLNVEPNSTGSQLTEARRAAHHAMSLALDMPAKNLTSTRPGNFLLHCILFLVYWNAWPKKIMKYSSTARFIEFSIFHSCWIHLRYYLVSTSHLSWGTVCLKTSISCYLTLRLWWKVNRQ